jgi:hypothetical protein
MTRKPYLWLKQLAQSDDDFVVRQAAVQELARGGKMTQKPYLGSNNWLNLMIIGMCDVQQSKN